MKKTAIVLLVMGMMLSSLAANAAEWTNNIGIGIRGPLWIPYDDIEGPEFFRMGLDGSIFMKYGITNNLVFDLSIGYMTTYNDTTATEDANFKFMSKDVANTKLNGILTGFTAVYYFLPLKRIQPYVLTGLGVDFWKKRPVEGEGNDISITDFNVKGGFGVNFMLSDNFMLDTQAKGSWGVANLSADDIPGVDFSKWNQRAFRGYIEPSVGLTYLFGGAAQDADGDGVVDKKDNCPDTPVNAIVDASGCPLDDDGDKVFNGLDNCPNTPMGAIVDIVGCPLDSDKDGVYDGLDKCPNTPPGALVDNTGCPKDSDGDGVFDGIDKCADTQNGCKVDASGCSLDGDGDGVCDGLDRCPRTLAGTKIDANGCPVDVKPPVQKITLNIKYKTGLYEPDDNAKQVLDELIKTMYAYTGTVIEIHGFTDWVGTESSNTILAQKRAEGVMNYLLKGGVERERMTVRGFGEDPNYFVGDNNTAEGRQKNRRTEIISVEK